jgi:hypothetical protein
MRVEEPMPLLAVDQYVSFVPASDDGAEPKQACVVVVMPA